MTVDPGLQHQCNIALKRLRKKCLKKSSSKIEITEDKKNCLIGYRRLSSMKESNTADLRQCNQINSWKAIRAKNALYHKTTK